ncbi:MAG: hypothetical protein MPJ25_14185 [Pirellulales bacterium]|nr:hypothetical protein [Pirellulales bacterium]
MLEYQLSPEEGEDDSIPGSGYSEKPYEGGQSDDETNTVDEPSHDVDEYQDHQITDDNLESDV